MFDIDTDIRFTQDIVLPKLRLAYLSKTCLRHARYSIHIQYTNPLENSSGFVLDLSKTCPLVASADTDLSVSGMS